jgi:hypothetical protein
MFWFTIVRNPGICAPSEARAGTPGLIGTNITS